MNNFYSNGLYNLATRLNQRGGAAQQDRMIQDKRWSLDHAIRYSYQGATITKINGVSSADPALINPNKVKQDYDDKIVSVGYEYNYAPGDIFLWDKTGTYWLIYLQDLTELAYFRGQIRRCKHLLSWKDELDGQVYSTLAAVRGPVETDIGSLQSRARNIDTPNLSLDFLIPLNEYSLRYFKRYNKFYLKSLQGENQDICWRIEAVDNISMPGIIQISAEEYYSNDFKDDKDKGIVDGLIIPPEPVEPQSEFIEGESFIKPKRQYDYIYTGEEIGEWTYNTKYPIKATINGNKISVTWTSNYSGQFDLTFGSATKTIVVESLF